MSIYTFDAWCKHSNKKRNALKELTQFRFLSESVYLFPIHLPGHWILCAVSCIRNTVFTYLADSLNSRNIDTAFYNENLITEAISQYFTEFADYGDKDINKVAMTLRYATVQPDQTACGYYVCACANLFLSGYLTSFMTEDELIPLTYGAAHDMRISMHKFLRDLKTVTVSHFEHSDKLISRLTMPYCNVEKDTNKAAVQSSVKKTPSRTPAPKKGTSSSKKRLNFDSDFGSPINYNLSTSAPSTPVRTSYNKDLLPGTERIELATADELARFLQEEEF
jgi:hypothetical protein